MSGGAVIWNPFTRTFDFIGPAFDPNTILTGYNSDDELDVLIDENGNVLTAP